MNYSVELWNSYNKVENNLLFHLRGLKDFIYMFQEINKSMKTFSDNLKKIFDMKLSITTNESLSSGIENFRNFLLFHHNFLEKYISNIISELINPLNTLQETILKKLNKNYKETLNAEKNYESYLFQIDFTKNKFHSRVRQIEKKLLDLEISKNKEKNNNDNNQEEEKEKDLDKSDIESDEDIKNAIGFAKDSEKIYLSYIKYTNRMQEEFIETKKRNLNEIQNLEIELGEKIKNCLNKYYSLQSNYCINLNLEIEKNIKLLDNININNDIEIFIKNNRTKDVPPFKFDYIPYICNLDKMNNSIDNENLKNINIKVKEEIKKLFPEEKDISLLKTKTDKEIENFIDSILKGEKENVINANEENLKIISNKNLRKLFLKYLNKLRNNNHIILNDSTYKIIGNLLKEAFRYSYKEKDFICIKLVMSIATTLFKINKIANKPRIFLNNYLINNQIWKNFNFWENLIKYDIVEEMHNQKKYNLFLDEKEDLKKGRIKDIVKSQINSNIYKMISFDASITLMNKIINYFSNFYKLEKNVVESFLQLINGCQSRKIVLDEKKKLNNSFELALKNKKKINDKFYLRNNSSKNTFSNNTTNNSKNYILSLDKDFKIIKNRNIIEPVMPYEQKTNEYFKEKEKDKKIFNKKNIKLEKSNNINIIENKNIIKDKIKRIKAKNNKKEKKEK